MDIKYQIFEDEKLLIQKFNDKFDFEKYVHYAMGNMSKISSFEINKILIDFRDIVFEGKEPPDDFFETVDKIINIRKEMKDKMNIRGKVKIVFLVDKPIPTVIAHMFQSNLPDSEYHYCSTENSVYTKLKLPRDFSIDSAINNLKESF